MKIVKKILITALIMVLVLGGAVGIDKGYKYFEAKQYAKEMEIRHGDSKIQVVELENSLSELSMNTEELISYINDNALVTSDEPTGYGDASVDFWEGEVITKRELEEEGYSEEEIASMGFAEDDEESRDMEESEAFDEGEEDEPEISGEEGSDEENADEEDFGEGKEDDSEISDEDVDEEEGIDASEEGDALISDEETEDSIEESEKDVLEEDLYLENELLGYEIYDKIISDEEEGNGEGTTTHTLVEVTLKDRQSIRSSFEETMLWKKSDTKVLEDNEEDFSELKLCCLGDSITEAINLDSMEDFQQYSYPTKLRETLGFSEVTNLGIGGSSIGRYWDNPFCERYQAIPEDTDVIFIMGGTNDGFCLEEDEVGSFEERAPRTLIGDLDELMRGLKENYPDAEIVFVTPLPNVLHDILRKDNEALLSQRVIVDTILIMAGEYDFECINLYDSNFLDSHDADILTNYMPDGVHPNPDGYELLARHIGAEFLRIHEEKAKAQSEESSMENQGLSGLGVVYGPEGEKLNHELEDSRLGLSGADSDEEKEKTELSDEGRLTLMPKAFLSDADKPEEFLTKEEQPEDLSDELSDESEEVQETEENPDGQKPEKPAYSEYVPKRDRSDS